MSLRSPLGSVRGLGSAREGAGHWWAQRISAVALILLGLWFAASMATLDLASHATVTTWIGAPVNALLLVLLIGTLAYHSKLGLEVVVEDYVRGAAKTVMLVVLNFLHVLVAVAGVMAILRISFGAAS